MLLTKSAKSLCKIRLVCMAHISRITCVPTVLDYLSNIGHGFDSKVASHWKSVVAIYY